jgi:integrase
VQVEIAQEPLGHASIAMTLTIYTHVVDASRRKAVEARSKSGCLATWTV